MVIGKLLRRSAGSWQALMAPGSWAPLRRVLLLLALAVAAISPYRSGPAQAQAGAQLDQQALAAQAAGPVAGVDLRLDSTERTARFQIALSQEVVTSVSVLGRPMRITVDLPEVTFQAAQSKARQRGLVTGFRAGLVAPGRSRLVFDLGAAAQVGAIRQTKRADGIVDMVIEFAATGAEDFERRVLQGVEQRAAAALAPLHGEPGSPNDTRPLVVIDPGHGGIDSGAVASSGIAEKTLVLAIASQLRAHLESSGSLRVIMTRSDDRFLSLSERVRIAREARADLFISLHADSLSAAQEVRGATVYTGSERATDAESARLAQKENAADAAGGAETAQPSEEVMDILMDLTRRETRAMSSAVAARLVTEMGGSIRMHRIPQRSAGFKVLTAPDVPSLLIELGYLSSKGDMALLTSPGWQQGAATAIGRAVHGHFRSRLQGRRNGASFSP
jgi:N-acetylmuramoyl-L-alanine amidase